MLVIQSTFWRKQAHGWVNLLAAEAPSVLPQHPGEEETTDTLLFLGPYKTHQSDKRHQPISPSKRTPADRTAVSDGASPAASTRTRPSRA